MHSSILTPRFSLDAIGLAGFSHNFGSLVGKNSPVSTVLDTVGSPPKRSAFDAGFFVLSQVFSALVYFPTKRNVLFQELRRELSRISNELLDRNRMDKESNIVDGKMDTSVIGLLRMCSLTGPVKLLTNPWFKSTLKTQIQISTCLTRKS